MGIRMRSGRKPTCCWHSGRPPGRISWRGPCWPNSFTARSRSLPAIPIIGQDRAMRYAAALAALLLLAAVIAAGSAGAQRGAGDFATVGDTRDALALALRQQQLAQRRAEQLETVAASATEQVEQTRAEAAALASRLQETEAALAAAGARLAIANLQYGAIRGGIAERQRPLIGLAATLQNFARRPLTVAVLRPGSLREAVYTRAILATALPEVRRRTEGLRGELDEAAVFR